MKHIFLALALTGCAAMTATEPTVTTAPVIAAERAFAARAGEVAWVPAFREFVAPDGQLAGPDGYSDAPVALAEAPDDANRLVFWWPAFAGISHAGDLGFTTGPVSLDESRTARGHYFTVWRRQPDGSWKWIYDGGVGPIAEPNLIAPDAADVPSLPVADAGPGQATAVVEVRALEAAGGFAGKLAADARVVRSRQPLVAGAAAAAAFAQPAAVTYELLRVEAASSGDLAAAFGMARWSNEGASVSTPYARVWQRRPEGWRIVYDQLIVPPPAPPPG